MRMPKRRLPSSRSSTHLSLLTKMTITMATTAIWPPLLLWRTLSIFIPVEDMLQTMGTAQLFLATNLVIVIQIRSRPNPLLPLAAVVVVAAAVAALLKMPLPLPTTSPPVE